MRRQIEKSVLRALESAGRADTIEWFGYGRGRGDKGHSPPGVLLVVDYLRALDEALYVIGRDGRAAHPRTTAALASYGYESVVPLFTARIPNYSDVARKGALALRGAVRDDADTNARRSAKDAKWAALDKAHPDWRTRAEELLRDRLDKTPASKSSRSAIRPPILMTLAEVQAAARKRNPAPMHDKGGAFYGRDARQVILSAMGIPDRERYSIDVPDAEVSALDGTAWRISAPEGFLPYPRRGGKYSPKEAAALRSWLETHWPVAVELGFREAARAEALDRGARNTGADSYRTPSYITEGAAVRPRHGNVMRKVFWSDHGAYEGDRRTGEEPTASRMAHKTPKEVAALINAWVVQAAPKALRLIDGPLYDADAYIRRDTPAKQDAHMAMWRDAVGETHAYDMVTHIAERLYGLSRFDKITSKHPQYGYTRETTLAEAVAEGSLKLSEALARVVRAKKADTAKRDVQAREARADIAAVRRALGTFAAAQDFTNIGQVRKLLPAGFKAEWEGWGDPYLRVHRPGRLAVFTGSSRTKKQVQLARFAEFIRTGKKP